MTAEESTHGLWCSARIKEASCRTCGEKVFLFFCDCGCMVLLQKTGDEWRLHPCGQDMNRFSPRDAFAVSRMLDRRLEEKELCSMDLRPEVKIPPPPGFPVTVTFRPVSA